jgi:hypothetical protein
MLPDDRPIVDHFLLTVISLRFGAVALLLRDRSIIVTAPSQMREVAMFAVFGAIIRTTVLVAVAAVATPAIAATAKISDFIVIHAEATIKASSSYASLSKLTDDELKKTVTAPQGSDYITVKAGTMSLRDGNTRVYLLKQRGFGALVVTYDTIDTGYRFYDD